MHQSDGDHLIPGPDHTVALHSAVLLTPVQDQGLDQDPDHTLIPQVGPGPVLVPMAGLTPVLLSLVAMGAVTGAPDQGPALVQDPTVTGALAHLDLLHHTVEQAGKDQMEQGPTGQDHDLDLPVASVAAALAVESHLLGIWCRMN